jgi:hypothetical protein
MSTLLDLTRECNANSSEQGEMITSDIQVVTNKSERCKKTLQFLLLAQCQLPGSVGILCGAITCTVHRTAIEPRISINYWHYNDQNTILQVIKNI